MPTARAQVAPGQPPPPTPEDAGPLDFGTVYEEHFDFVWRSVRRLGVAVDAIDDVVQDVFVTVHRKLDEFQGRSQLKTWIFGIALGHVRNHRRSKRRHRAVFDQGRPIDEAADAVTEDRPSEPGPYASAKASEAVSVLYAVLDTLEDRRREVFVLAELEQMPVPQIAELTDTNLNTVYARLRAARKDFEASLARHLARDEGAATRMRLL